MGCIEADLLPALCSIGVTGALQFPDHAAGTVQQLHSEGIFTRARPAGGLTVTPVIDGDVRGSARYGKVLPDGIIAPAVATQVGAVLAMMGICRVDEFGSRARARRAER